MLPAILILALMGAIDPAVTQDTIAVTICQPGYAASGRPPAKWAARTKRRLLHGRPGRDYQLDHIVPLEVGGAPMDPANLQLEPWPEARTKDRLENSVHRQVCAGRMTLEQGQALFRQAD